MKRLSLLCLVAWFLSWNFATPAHAQDTAGDRSGLVGHWPLLQDGKDISGHGHHAVARGIRWLGDSANNNRKSGAEFDGRGMLLEVPPTAQTSVGSSDFSVAAWVWADEATDDIPGDIVSQYDSSKRRGWHLGLKTNTGVTFNQANYRQLQFGIDSDQISTWRDCGKPGKNSLLAFGLTAHDGRLFAGTCEPNEGDAGRVYIYSHGQEWQDCGSPALSNSIMAMAAFRGELYVGTGKYRVAGSSLAESTNANLGGHIFRYGGTKADGTSIWTDCGQLPNTEAVGGMVVYRGRLYASSLYKPAGFFRYEGGQKWSDIGVPDGKRVEALAVYNQHIYASSYDCGRVYRFDGHKWTDLGQLGDSAENTQTYSFAVYQGGLYAGTWRSGKVYLLDEMPGTPPESSRFKWLDVGRLGEELEVMGMLVHNGRLMAGTLPLAEVYQYNGGDNWQRLTQLDTTPDVRFRRAWTMAEYRGQLFCSTLPNGHVYACEVGKLTTWDYEFPTGWHHVTAVKSGGKLQLYVDGKLKSSSTDFNPADFDLSSDQPIKIGSGPNDFYSGRLRDVRLYRRALTAEDASALASARINE